MMRKSSLLVTLLMLVTFTVQVCGNDSVRYSSALLQRTAEALKLHMPVEQPHSSVTFKTGGKTIVARYDENGVVEHIGVNLFDNNLRKMQPSPVYDYIEFSLLNHHFHVDEKAQEAGDITFERGSWASLDAEALKDASVTLAVNDTRQLCRLSWSRADETVVSMTFALKYDRMARATMQELEDRLWQRIIAYHEHDSLPPQPASLERSNVKNIMERRGGTFQIEDIKNVTYYNSRGQLVCDNRHPVHTLYNMMLSPSSLLPAKKLVLKLKFKDRTTEIPLRRLVQYFTDNNAKLYLGIKESNNRQLSATLYAVESGSGCFHMFGIEVPTSTLLRPEEAVVAEAQLYIPMDKDVNAKK